MSNYVSGMSYKTTDGKVINFGLASKKSCVTIASVTSSEKARAVADFIIPNDETIVNELQAAFNSIPSTGGEIHLCAGTYDFNKLASVSADSEFGRVLDIPYSNITVSGEGNGTVITYDSGSDDVCLMQAFGLTNICIRDMRFKVGYGADGIVLENCRDSVVTNCIFSQIDSDAYGCIDVRGGSANTIVGNHFTPCEYNTCIILGSNSTSTLIANNTFTYGEWGGSDMIYMTGASDTMIQGNLFRLSDDECALRVITRSGSSGNTRGCFINNYISLNGSACESAGVLKDLKIDNVVVTV